MNVITITGRLTRDAELRHTQSGRELLGFSVASDVGWGDNKHANFFNCTVWGKRAEALEPHLKKGLPVTVIGEFDVREYETKAGEKRSALQVNVSEVEMQGSVDKNREAQQDGFRDRPQRRAEAKAERVLQAPTDDLDEGDIPF